MEQKKRVALVTGGNKGIGLEIARELGRAGITVLLGVRSLDRGEGAASTLRREGIDAHAIKLDVTDEASVTEAASQILQRFNALDILVNNAGVNDAGDGRPSAASTSAVRRILETNFIGALTVTQAMLTLLRSGTSPRIVNMSSSLGSLTMNGDPMSPYYRAQLIGYNASKAALNMLTVQLAQELRDSGIDVNSACPGFVATDLNGHTGSHGTHPDFECDVCGGSVEFSDWLDPPSPFAQLLRAAFGAHLGDVDVDPESERWQADVIDAFADRYELWRYARLACSLRNLYRWSACRPPGCAPALRAGPCKTGLESGVRPCASRRWKRYGDR